VQYSDTTKHLFVETTGTIDDVSAFYRTALSAAGWKATTEKPVEIGWKQVLIFRNPAKDMLELEMFNFEDNVRLNVSHKSLAEVAELERRLKQESDQKQQQTQSKTVERIVIVIPNGAENVKVSNGNDEITFNVKVGQARTAVEAVRDSLTSAGWKVLQTTLEPMFGNVMLDKDSQPISLAYVETGVLPSEVTISSFGEIELEQAE
jgi:hypothetical protein